MSFDAEKKMQQYAKVRKLIPVFSILGILLLFVYRQFSGSLLKYALFYFGVLFILWFFIVADSLVNWLLRRSFCGDEIGQSQKRGVLHWAILAVAVLLSIYLIYAGINNWPAAGAYFDFTSRIIPSEIDEQSNEPYDQYSMRVEFEVERYGAEKRSIVTLDYEQYDSSGFLQGRRDTIYYVYSEKDSCVTYFDPSRIEDPSTHGLETPLIVAATATHILSNTHLVGDPEQVNYMNEDCLMYSTFISSDAVKELLLWKFGIMSPELYAEGTEFKGTHEPSLYTEKLEKQNPIQLPISLIYDDKNVIKEIKVDLSPLFNSSQDNFLQWQFLENNIALPSKITSDR